MAKADVNVTIVCLLLFESKEVGENLYTHFQRNLEPQLDNNIEVSDNGCPYVDSSFALISTALAVSLAPFKGSVRVVHEPEF